MQHTSVLTFVSVFFTVQVLIALAVSYFLARWFPLYRRRSVRIIYWCITLVAYVAIFCRRVIITTDTQFKEFIMFLLSLSYVWSVGLLVMLVGFILISLFRLPGLLAAFVKKRKKQPVPVDVPSINRRTFLKSAGVALPFFSFGLGVEGVINANSKIVLTRRQLTLPGLSAELDGLKIAQISDAHIGAYFGMDKLERVIGMIEEEKPHLLVITGDFIDDLPLLPSTFDLLNPFAAKLPYGAYFCWGNHEYFQGKFKHIKKYFDQSPVTVLKNENKLVVKAASPLYLVGVDYPFARADAAKKAMRQKYLSTAMKGLPAKATPILISHHSDFIEEAFDAGIPLTLAGHTHGGQAALFGKSLLPVSYKYMLGMYSQQNCHAYVSTGAGHWFPFRFNCPAEVVVFTLKSSS